MICCMFNSITYINFKKQLKKEVQMGILKKYMHYFCEVLYCTNYYVKMEMLKEAV